MNDMKIRYYLLFLLLLIAIVSFSQDYQTFTYALKDERELKLDFYNPAEVDSSTFCVMFIFGGGFVSGQRDGKYEKQYFKDLVEEGFQVAAIDYRLGLKGAKNIGITNYEPLQNAIEMAAEDAISALSFLIQHAEDLHLNPRRIVLIGCSAGAITALQTDYALCNGFLNADLLPADFRLAGVVSYAGAIFSTNGKVKYRNHAPAPTMFFHGTADKLVNYKQVRLFNVGFIGSSKIVPQFQKYGYPYYFRRYTGYGHLVAMAFLVSVDELKWFCKNYIDKNEQWQVDETLTNLALDSLPAFDSAKPKDLYK